MKLKHCTPIHEVILHLPYTFLDVFWVRTWKSNIASIDIGFTPQGLMFQGDLQ